LQAKEQTIENIALQFYQLGLGFRAAGRFLKVSNVSVLNWAKKAGCLDPNIEYPLSIRAMELDKTWYYCQRKEKSVALVSNLL